MNKSTYFEFFLAKTSSSLSEKSIIGFDFAELGRRLVLRSLDSDVLDLLSGEVLESSFLESEVFDLLFGETSESSFPDRRELELLDIFSSPEKYKKMVLFKEKIDLILEALI
jgi:hypothetical protein